ncbi:Do family serine endopeptidase [Psychromonas sp. PT13]|uniref:Do family serine endopeptidase n=1 Tax=Psychromonas sp. PT13 TaxID=3439547 RepID=UPI003EB6C109
MNKRAINISISLLLGLLLTLSAPSYAAKGNQLFPSLAPMLKEVNAAVVNISTFSTQTQTVNPLLNDPFFKHFFNTPDQPQQQQQQKPQKQQQSAGSGVIVDAKKGIVLTNNHVIDKSEEILVSLIDGRSFTAKLLGTDPELDIAILQIDADNLTEVEIADSNLLEVGDFVVAIGNPFGLGQTVTTGIVSALGRSGLGIEGYENFIQTDASINPGNSGGALVNLAGELIGINTAIIAPSGGNVGIGFAIPVNMVKASMNQITENGEVRRGQIGVGIQDITPALRDAFGLKNGQLGVLISKVVSGSPAEKAGIKAGDIITQVDGEPTISTGQLRSRIGIRKIGDKVKLTVLRDVKEISLTVTIGEPQTTAKTTKTMHSLLDGVELGNEENGNGVIVTRIVGNSIAAYSGLRQGDVIVATNKQRTKNLDDFRNALKLNDQAILLQINRDGGSLFVVVR